jgi:DNA-binding transcriptional MocR family regulator
VLQNVFNKVVYRIEDRVAAQPEHRSLVATAVLERTPKGIAAAVNRLIRDERLRPGDRLPTVRELAADLGVSPATVSEAWQALSAVGSIVSRGRAGSYVRAAVIPSRPVRYLGIGGAPTARGLDLSTGTPDPALLPSLTGAMARVGDRSRTSSYLDDPVLPELREHLAGTWPFAPQRLTIVDGALDALARVVEVVVRLGDRVVMEDPGFPALIDLLERAGADIVPVPLDGQGIDVDRLRMAMDVNPVAVFIQPRAQNPTGTSMTRLRASEVAAVVDRSRAVVVEDDHSGDIAVAEDVSVGAFLPDQTVHIRSYSKSHGPDLRMAAVGGTADVLDALAARRMLGAGWTSRILQGVVLELLTDTDAVEAVAEARTRYSARSARLRERLRDYGLSVSPGDGINVWVQVPDERTSLVALAARGIRVAPGAPFQIAPGQGSAIRVTCGALPDDPDVIDTVAAAIAGVEAPVGMTVSV